MGGGFGPEMGRQMIEHAGRFGTHGSGVMRLVPLLLFAGLIGVLIWGFLRMSPRGAPVPASGGSPDAALESIRLRYARGEIDREEFVQRTRDLGGTVADEDAG